MHVVITKKSKIIENINLLQAILYLNSYYLSDLLYPPDITVLSCPPLSPGQRTSLPGRYSRGAHIYQKFKFQRVPGWMSLYCQK